jgi:hypothetical protein
MAEFILISSIITTIKLHQFFFNRIDSTIYIIHITIIIIIPQPFFLRQNSFYKYTISSIITTIKMHQFFFNWINSTISIICIITIQVVTTFPYRYTISSIITTIKMHQFFFNRVNSTISIISIITIIKLQPLFLIVIQFF